MSVFHNSALIGASGQSAGGGGGGYEIERSVRLNPADSAHFSRTPASNGNRRTWTWAAWVKRGTLGTIQHIFEAYTATDIETFLRFDTDNALKFATYNSGYVFELETTALFRDPSAWYHFVIVLDTTNGTEADRARIYINGTRITTFDTATYPTLNSEHYVNDSSYIHYIGKNGFASRYFDGYLADVFLIDGQALDPTSFGEFDANGVWNPIEYTGSYGTNGFHLPFSDNSTAAALGTDTSGNGNDWTVNNITAVAPSYSSPTNANTPVYDITIGPTNPLSGVGVWSDAFNGDSNTYGIIGPITFINTKPTWSTSTGVELMASGNGITASVNGGTQVALANNAFVTISSGSSGTLNYIWIYNSAGSASITRVRVDGVDISVRALLGSASDIDSLVDVPTNGTETDTGAGGEVKGNYCTLNPLQKGSNTSLANGNLDFSNTANEWNVCLSTIFVSSGKWYCETVVNNAAGSGSGWGIAKNSHAVDTYLGVTADGWALYGNTANSYTFTNNADVDLSYCALANGDVLGMALDMDAGTLTYYVNNVSQGTAFSGITGSVCFAVTAYASGVTSAFNFGQRPFAYTAPSGFKALNTASLSDPVITKPSEYMDVKLYTGNGSTQTISGLGFSPDLVWIKNRTSNGYNHLLYDQIRTAGVNKALSSDQLAAEGSAGDNTTYGYMSAFETDGFTVVRGTDATSLTNGSTQSYAAWTWDAGSSTVTNNDGSISSQVRSNGYLSIVTWSGSGSSATIGHGLGAIPGLILCKDRGSNNWVTQHISTGQNYIALNLALQAYFDANIWNAAPTSSTFSVGGGTNVNGSGRTYVAYCFAPVDGYSSFGSYTGNGSADGPFVYTGFRPKWIMFKRTDDTSNWTIVDTQRDTYNLTINKLFADTSTKENVSDPPGVDANNNRLDILSNGFKHRDANTWLNGSGGTYIYAAFAESPYALNNRAR